MKRIVSNRAYQIIDSANTKEKTNYGIRRTDKENTHIPRLNNVDVLIDTYSNDYIKSITDSKYEKGASDYIVKAFLNYSGSNFCENN